MDNELIGFCGLRHRDTNVSWDNEDINVLQVIGLAMAEQWMRTQIEKRLADEHNLLRALIDNVPDTLYAKDTKGRFLVANRAAASIANLTPQSIVGRNDFELFTPEVAQRYVDDEQAVIRSSEPLIERIEIVPDASGARRWYSSTKVPLRDVDGRIIGIIGAGRDITDNKQIEEALHDSAIRFRALFNGMTEGVALHELVYDGDGKPVNYVVLDVNPQFETILGIKGASVVGKLATDAYETPLPPYLNEYAAVAVSGNSYHFETYYQPLGRYFYISASRIGAGRFATIFYDITQRVQLEAELRKAESDYRMLYETDVMGIYQSTPAGRFIGANLTMARMFGYDSAQEMIATVGNDIATHMYADPKQREEVLRIMDADGVVNDFESTNLTRDGRTIWIRENSRAVRDADGSILYIDGFVEDITERKQTEAALRLSEERFRILTENSRDIIWTVDVNYKMTYCSPAARVLLGYEPAEIINGDQTLIFTPESYQAMQALFQKEVDDYANGKRDNTYEIDVQHKHHDGTKVWVNILIQRILNADGVKIGLLGVSRDITARKHADEKLQYLSTHDMLTGLYNRSYYEDALARIYATGAFPVSVIMADIDGLKVMNDRHGHSAGDQLLTATAQVLRAFLRANDIVARIGGDEFAVLCPGASESAGIMVMERLRAELSRYNASHPEMPLSISLGAATATHLDRPDELMNLADKRMYDEKRLRRVQNEQVIVEA
jgi:diguanylate cyclase (GGDEF)-like protein/PAS domain S-box-containing protein